MRSVSCQERRSVHAVGKRYKQEGYIFSYSRSAWFTLQCDEVDNALPKWLMVGETEAKLFFKHLVTESRLRIEAKLTPGCALLISLRHAPPIVTVVIEIHVLHAWRCVSE